MASIFDTIFGGVKFEDPASRVQAAEFIPGLIPGYSGVIPGLQSLYAGAPSGYIPMNPMETAGVGALEQAGDFFTGTGVAPEVQPALDFYGDWFQGGGEDYIDAAVRRTLPAVNSAFVGAGREGSPAHTSAVSREVGDAAALASHSFLGLAPGMQQLAMAPGYNALAGAEAYGAGGEMLRADAMNELMGPYFGSNMFLEQMGQIPPLQTSEVTEQDWYYNPIGQGLGFGLALDQLFRGSSGGTGGGTLGQTGPGNGPGGREGPGSEGTRGTGDYAGPGTGPTQTTTPGGFLGGLDNFMGKMLDTFSNIFTPDQQSGPQSTSLPGPDPGAGGGDSVPPSWGMSDNVLNLPVPSAPPAPAPSAPAPGVPTPTPASPPPVYANPSTLYSLGSKLFGAADIGTAGLAFSPAGFLMGGYGAMKIADQLFGSGDYPQISQTGQTSAGEPAFLSPINPADKLDPTPHVYDHEAAWNVPQQDRAGGATAVTHLVLEGPHKGKYYEPYTAVYHDTPRGYHEGVNLVSQNPLGPTKFLNPDLDRG